ncbi:UPF0702 transmembrane protein YrbG [Halobacillus andaensis]|uniref:UPF0702 transmembrane protein YrbG n=1 Tax=Halobacillus andaensis TaxID=1176239 RepID=A0A917B010_HALAA|nr:DUF421 domain-containing protein [Halobacillus andaensis]MBP2002976.1 uncharacterized membrane protein YcaP (DUF421 family) [Halobacillus andaensis]GGF07087.1 UPF0702 transmembrane protein YrbG [Halobacillus andaensis]
MVFELLIRTVVTYFSILIIFRLMGKREIGELSVMDLVVFIMLAEIAVFLIEKPDDSVWRAIVPMVVLLSIQWGSAALSLRSKKFRDWFDGKPSVLIKHGKIDEREMRRQRYNFSDLLLQLREQEIQHIGDVDFAILEPSGKLSVFKKKENETSDYAVVLIEDGNVQYAGLKEIQKNKDWLMNEIEKKGYRSVEEISLCTINLDGEICMDEEDERK